MTPHRQRRLWLTCGVMAPFHMVRDIKSALILPDFRVAAPDSAEAILDSPGHFDGPGTPSYRVRSGLSGLDVPGKRSRGRT